MVVVVGIGGGVDQVQILVDVGVGDGVAVHGREVLEPRGRGPVAASIGAGGAAPRCVAARHEGAGLAQVEGSATSCARRRTGCPSCRRGAPSCLPTPPRAPEASPDHAHAAAAARRPRGPRSAAAPCRAPPPRSRRKRSWPVAYPALLWCWWRHLDEMLTFGVCHNMTSAIDVGSSPTKIGHRHLADGRRRASSLGCPVVPGGTVFGVLFARERGRGATRGRRAERDHRVLGLDIGFPSDASDSS